MVIPGRRVEVHRLILDHPDRTPINGDETDRTDPRLRGVAVLLTRMPGA
jgi:hypothetical protein